MALLSTLVLLVSVIAVGGQAQAAHVSCGDSLTANTTLDDDLTCETAPGLVIGANNITLDCAGHSISGPGASGDPGILLSGRSGVTVKDCRVRNFLIGFRVEFSSGNTLVDNRADKNGLLGVLLLASNNNTLTNNRANENSFGITLSGVFGGSHNNTLTGNKANENSSHGIQVENSSGNTLTGNRANENGVFGFTVFLPSSFGNTLTGNKANENGSAGFFLQSGASNNTLTGNRANENGQFGFWFTSPGASNNTLTMNEACENGTFDAFQEAGVNTFVDNEFCTTSGF